MSFFKKLRYINDFSQIILLTVSMVSHASNKCPLCGTFGRNWREEKEVFECPNCFSIYSEFGIVLEPRKDDNTQNMWN